MLPRGLDTRIDTFGPRPRACVIVVPPRSACQQLLNCDQCGTAAQTPRQKLCMGRAKHRKLKKAGTKTLVSLDKKLPSRRPPEHKRFREQQIAKEKMAKKKRKAPGSHPPIKSHGDLPTPKQRSPAAEERRAAKQEKKRAKKEARLREKEAAELAEAATAESARLEKEARCRILQISRSSSRGLNRGRGATARRRSRRSPVISV